MKNIKLFCFLVVLINFWACKKEVNSSLQSGMVFKYSFLSTVQTRLFSKEGEIKNAALISGYLSRHNNGFNFSAFTTFINDTIRIINSDSCVVTENQGWASVRVPYKMSFNGDCYISRSINAGGYSVDPIWEPLLKYNRIYYPQPNGSLTADFYLYFKYDNGSFGVPLISLTRVTKSVSIFTGAISFNYNGISRAGFLEESNVQAFLNPTDTLLDIEQKANYLKL